MSCDGCYAARHDAGGTASYCLPRNSLLAILTAPCGHATWALPTHWTPPSTGLRQKGLGRAVMDSRWWRCQAARQSSSLCQINDLVCRLCAAAFPPWSSCPASPWPTGRGCWRLPLPAWAQAWAQRPRTQAWLPCFSSRHRTLQGCWHRCWPMPQVSPHVSMCIHIVCSSQGLLWPSRIPFWHQAAPWLPAQHALIPNPSKSLFPATAAHTHAGCPGAQVEWTLR